MILACTSCNQTAVDACRRHGGNTSGDLSPKAASVAERQATSASVELIDWEAEAEDFSFSAASRLNRRFSVSFDGVQQPWPILSSTRPKCFYCFSPKCVGPGGAKRRAVEGGGLNVRGRRHFGVNIWSLKFLGWGQGQQLWCRQAGQMVRRRRSHAFAVQDPQTNYLLFLIKCSMDSIRAQCACICG